MSELAFDRDGEPIDVPGDAVAWKVRKLPPRGPAQVVYTADGIPLFLPITAGIEDLRRAVDLELEGSYQLDPVDVHHRRIADTPSRYLRLRSHQGIRGPGSAVVGLPIADLLALARTSVDLAHAILEQVAVLLDTAGTLVRTAEDAEQAVTAIRELTK